MKTVTLIIADECDEVRLRQIHLKQHLRNLQRRWQAKDNDSSIFC